MNPTTTYSARALWVNYLKLNICFVLQNFEKWLQTNRGTTFVNFIITIDHDCGLAEWIMLEIILRSSEAAGGRKGIF